MEFQCIIHVFIFHNSKHSELIYIGTFKVFYEAHFVRLFFRIDKKNNKNVISCFSLEVIFFKVCFFRHFNLKITYFGSTQPGNFIKRPKL